MIANECALCGKVITPTNFGDLHDFTCPRCGQYRCTTEFLLDCRNMEHRNHVALSGAMRSAAVRGEYPPVLTTTTYQAYLAQAPKTISEKAFALLAALVRMTPNFGDEFNVSFENDWPLAYAGSKSEFQALIAYLHERHFIVHRPLNLEHRIFVKAEGFEELELRKRQNSQSEKAFIAMWFHSDLKQVYDEQIAVAVADAGYRPVRVDLEEFNDDVVARILAEIREARFVIADFTGNRNGVYFEAGFALGLSLPVIWLCRDSDIQNAHFDTNHFNHLTWTLGKPFHERLATRILATIGRGPVKVEA